MDCVHHWKIETPNGLADSTASYQAKRVERAGVRVFPQAPRREAS